MSFPIPSKRLAWVLSPRGTIYHIRRKKRGEAYEELTLCGRETSEYRTPKILPLRTTLVCKHCLKVWNSP